MVAYVHIEYSTYQFSEESKGGGIHLPPPGPCGTENKRGPKRLKKESQQIAKFFYPLN